MKYVYQHEFDKNYLVVQGENNIYNYCLGMLLHNDINGLLSMKINHVNNMPNYLYEITSKQSVRELYSVKKITYEELKRLLKGIVDLAKELQRYLLDINCVIFEPEHIYIDMDTMEPAFIYYTENDIPYQDSIRQLCRFFLEIIDHNNKELVEYAYNVYCKSMEENISFDSFVNEEQHVENYIDEREREYVAESCIVEEKSFIDKIMDFVRGMISDKPQIENEEFDEVYDEYETSLLTIEENTARLISVDDGMVFEINKTPYIVGKSSSQADGVILSDSVSRIHAKIFEDNCRRYIEDMNSKNGTYVNGVRISPYEKTELCSGDKLRFSASEYIYQEQR